MRESVRQFVRIISESIPLPEPIYEFGSYQVEGQEGFADLRPFFAFKTYIGCDIRQGKGVDMILDLHNIDLPDDTAGTVLLVDTLEHVEFCRKAMAEVFRILKPGGIVVITSVMNFPIHDYPHDYWRFTPAGLNSLLAQFSFSVTDFLGDADFPHTVVALGMKKGSLKEDALSLLIKNINTWKSGHSPLKKSGLAIKIIKQLSPPIFTKLLKRIRNR